MTQHAERVEVEAFCQDTNYWVVRTPGRNYPAMVVQGDSFSQLFGLAQSILDRARACSCADAELVEEAGELRDMLWGRLHHYESILEKHDFRLPYDRRLWPK